MIRQGRNVSVVYRHVLCVYPYRVELGRRERFYPPLGLEIIAAVLEPCCKAIDVVDLRRETGRTKDFLRPDTDLVCFSVNWACEGDFVREEIRSVPEHVLTIVGGRHATEDPESWLSDCPNIDVLVRGHGEETIKDIAQGRPLGKTTGVSYRSDGRLVHNPIREYGQVPEQFSPNRRLRRYTYGPDHPHVPAGLTIDTVASSLGCPYNCTFCACNRNPWGGKRAWSGRSPEAVVNELEQIDAQVVGFVDDNFTHDMDRVGRMCDLIVERGIKKKYIIQSRIDVARRPDVLRKMERAGVHYFTLYDQSALGRFDGENYQIGFLDVCDRPYEELARAARESHERLYRVASGEVEPFDDAPEYLPRLFA